jgi:hypothetical protein
LAKCRAKPLEALAKRKKTFRGYTPFSDRPIMRNNHDDKHDDIIYVSQSKRK